MTRPAREDGMATMQGLIWIGVLLSIGCACILAVGVLTTHRRAQGAADLAALAGAQALVRGESACAAAGDVADHNRASVTTCTVTDRDVVIAVSVAAPAVFPQRFEFRARARAGPETLGGLTPRDLAG